MVDVLKKPAFTRECFPILEEMKREREAPAVTALVASQEPVWRAEDPRWLVNPPWLFRPFTLRFGGRCVYCGEPIPAGASELYSRKIQSVAHRACHADADFLPKPVKLSKPATE